MLRLLLVTVLLITPISADRFSKSQRKAMLDAHNSRRRELALGKSIARDGVLDKAANMKEVKWDPELEAYADEVVETCVWGHPADLKTGQNLAAQMPHNSPDRAVSESAASWWGEIKGYSDGGSFGHFTQMAWAETDRIGCALKNCTNGKAQKFDYDDWTFTACNYMPQGNVVSYDVYIPGKPCSKCGNKGVCKNGLCVA